MKFRYKSSEEWINNFKTKIDESTKWAFAVAFFSTIICHLKFFVNNWANEDSLFAPFVEQEMLGSGRWMPGNLFSRCISTIVLLIIVAIGLGFVSVMINKMFKNDNKLYASLIAVLLTTFPVLAMSFGYSFMIERYMFGLVSSVLAVYIVDKNKYGFVIGGVLLAISLGYYQSYITVSIALVMMMLLFKIFESKEKKELGKEILKYMAMGIIGVGIYLFIVKVVYNIAGVELLEYKGLDNMGSIPPFAEWPYLISRTYGHVIYFLLGKRFYNPSWIVVFAQVYLVVLGIFLTLKVVRAGKKDRLFKIGACIFWVMIFPFAINVLDFVMYETHLSTLNIYQFVSMFILPFLLLNYIKRRGLWKNDPYNIMELLCLICISVVIWSDFSLTNTYYAKMEKFNEETILVTNRILDRVERQDGVSSSTKVFFGNRVGVYGLSSDTKTVYDNYITFDQGLWSPYVGYSAEQDFSDYKIHAVIKNVTGRSFEQISDEERKDIIKSEKYETMDAFPSEDCIEQFGDILVVKLS